MTNVKLELLNDYTMLQMIEHGMRGGVSSVCGDRYVDVEGKNYVTNANIDKDDLLQEWLLYLDANNLYGHSMSQKLPTGYFHWLSPNLIELLDKVIRTNTYDDSKYGYILNVDLVVPKTKKFENYPLAPENKVIKASELLDYSKTLLESGDS